MRKAMRKIWIAMVAVSLLFCAPLTVCAAKTVKLPAIRVSQNYGKAQEILKLINKERKKRKLKPLKLDKSLTKHAITRAAENFVLITPSGPHMRPNGKENSTGKIIHENCYQTGGFINDAKDIVEEWMSSPSHKKGILLPEAKSIGIAAVLSRGKYDSIRENCVLEFSNKKAKSIVKTKKTKRYSINISALKKYRKKKYFNISVSFLEIDDLSYGGDDIFRVVVKYDSPWYPLETVLDGKAFTWKSSDPATASIAKDGTVTWHKNGTVTFTAVMKVNKKMKFSLTYDRYASPEYLKLHPDK